MLGGNYLVERAKAKQAHLDNVPTPSLEGPTPEGGGRREEEGGLSCNPKSLQVAAVPDRLSATRELHSVPHLSCGCW